MATVHGVSSDQSEDGGTTVLPWVPRLVRTGVSSVGGLFAMCVTRCRLCAEPFRCVSHYEPAGEVRGFDNDAWHIDAEASTTLVDHWDKLSLCCHKLTALTPCRPYREAAQDTLISREKRQP